MFANFIQVSVLALSAIASVQAFDVNHVPSLQNNAIERVAETYTSPSPTQPPATSGTATSLTNISGYASISHSTRYSTVTSTTVLMITSTRTSVTRITRISSTKTVTPSKSLTTVLVTSYAPPKPTSIKPTSVKPTYTKSAATTIYSTSPTNTLPQVTNAASAKSFGGAVMLAMCITILTLLL